MFGYLGSFFVNFLIVFASIALFFAPFVLAFWVRHRQSIQAANPHFNYFMERFFSSREFNIMVAVWAMLEALVWFVIPEFLLILVIFMKVHKKFDLVKFDLVGTIIGTVIGFYVFIDDTLFLKFPYVYETMLDKADLWFSQLGVLGLINQPFSGVPYKVFIHSAHDYQFSILVFLVVAVAARMTRYLVVYEMTKTLYPLFHRFVRKHYGWLFVFATAIFTALLMRVTQLYQ